VLIFAGDTILNETFFTFRQPFVFSFGNDKKRAEKQFEKRVVI